MSNITPIELVDLAVEQSTHDVAGERFVIEWSEGARAHHATTVAMEMFRRLGWNAERPQTTFEPIVIHINANKRRYFDVHAEPAAGEILVLEDLG